MLRNSAYSCDHQISSGLFEYPPAGLPRAGKNSVLQWVSSCAGFVPLKQGCERQGASRRLKRRDLLAIPAASALPLTTLTRLASLFDTSHGTKPAQLRKRCNTNFLTAQACPGGSTASALLTHERIRTRAKAVNPPGQVRWRGILNNSTVPRDAGSSSRGAT